MRFFNELVEASGLVTQKNLVLTAIVGSAVIFGLAVFLITSVITLALCLGIFVLAAGLEVLRVLGGSRQRSLEKLWPQVFDSFQNAAHSGIGLEEQLEYLSSAGPMPLRSHFGRLGLLLASGYSIEIALQDFRTQVSNRYADLLTILLILANDLGPLQMAENWARLSSEIRQEQGVIGQVLAKQGWVSGSAKVALLAPWLIALVLVQLEQNRVAFASDLGSAVLVFGLLLSFVAYTLVNRLGRLPTPQRLFNGAY